MTMPHRNVLAAFDLLLGELRSVGATLREQGSAAFQRGQLDAVEQLATKVREVDGFISDIVAKQEQWRHLVDGARRRRQRVIRAAPEPAVAEGEHRFGAQNRPSRAIGEVLGIASKGVVARGREGETGFVVLAGSEAVVAVAPHLKGAALTTRSFLLREGVLAREGDHLSFTRDHVFGSPSAAAVAVLGRSADGRIEWKTADGRPLKQLQEGAAKRPAPTRTKRAAAARGRRRRARPTHFRGLLEFAEKRMRMVQAYQPVVLIELLRHGGERSTTDLARAIQSRLSAQAEVRDQAYYEGRVTNMAGKVLLAHRVVTRQGDLWHLPAYPSLTPDQVQRVISALTARLAAWEAAKGGRT